MKILTDLIHRGFMAALFLLIALAAGARTISGIVVDENDEPLAGATVREVSLDPDRSVGASSSFIQTQCLPDHCT